MATSRKKRSDSIDNQTEIMDRLKTKIEAPIRLSPEDSRVFDEVIAGLPSDMWDSYRIRLAANLAKMIGMMEALMIEVSEEGFVLDNKRGTPVCNPKQNALMQVTSTIQSLTRTLGLSASQRGVSETTTAAKKSAEGAAREAIDKAAGSDGLLA